MPLSAVTTPDSRSFAQHNVLAALWVPSTRFGGWGYGVGAVGRNRQGMGGAQTESSPLIGPVGGFRRRVALFRSPSNHPAVPGQIVSRAPLSHPPDSRHVRDVVLHLCDAAGNPTELVSARGPSLTDNEQAQYVNRCRATPGETAQLVRVGYVFGYVKIKNAPKGA
jgi:hypothetical protein